MIAYQILLGISLLVAVLFTMLIFLTGKGDAMSGGGSVRTSFKGKASFDDIVSRLTLWLGVAFMALMLLLDVVGGLAFKARDRAANAPATTQGQQAPAPQTPATPVVPPPGT